MVKFVLAYEKMHMTLFSVLYGCMPARVSKSSYKSLLIARFGDLCWYKRLYVFGGRGRTRTDADGRGHFIIFFIYFLAYIDLRSQLERDRLGHPPPPTHHDPMKIYRVYRYLHAQKYTLFVDLHV